MPIAVGVAKQLVYKKEVTWGTAPGASGAQRLRRVSSDIDLSKETYQSNEIRTDYQVSDMRHGVRRVSGSMSGELSAGTYKDFMASVCRQAFQTAATTGAVITVTSAVTAGASGTFTRSSGSYLTDGFKVGDVIRWTGWATPATANNTHNFIITALTATVMTGTMLDGVAVVAKAAGDSVTGTVAGKKTWVPTTGHTDESYSIEHYYSDITQSELFTGCKINQMDVKLPATGMGTIDFQVMGKDVTAAGAAYYTSPTAMSTGATMAAVNGALYVAGNAVALLTGLDFTVNGNMSSEPVVGSNTVPDIHEGRVTVSGSMTVFFQDATFRDYFLNETEVSLVAAFTGANTAGADVMVFVMPRIKVGGATKDDGEKGLIMTMPFTALHNAAGGTGISSEQTTISIQDSSVS